MELKWEAKVQEWLCKYSRTSPVNVNVGGLINDVYKNSNVPMSKQLSGPCYRKCGIRRDANCGIWTPCALVYILWIIHVEWNYKRNVLNFISHESDDDRDGQCDEKGRDFYTPISGALAVAASTSMHMDNISYCLIKSLNDEFPFFYGCRRRSSRSCVQCK